MSQLTRGYLNDSLQNLDHKFEQRLQSLDEKLDQRFELQRRSMEEMLANFGKMIVDVLDKRTTNLDNRMEAGFTELRHDMTDVKKRLDKLQTDMDMAKIRIYDVENELRVRTGLSRSTYPATFLLTWIARTHTRTYKVPAPAFKNRWVCVIECS